jgi:hypothetical protein
MASVSTSSNFWSSDILTTAGRVNSRVVQEGVFDFITDFWKNRATLSDIESLNQQPKQVLSSFAAKVVTPMWLAVLELLSGVLSNNEYFTYDFENMSINTSAAKIKREISNLRKALSAVNRSRRRILWYIDHMRINLQALGFPLGISDLRPLTNDTEDKAGLEEFSVILEQLQFAWNRAESLLPVVIGACSILEAQQGALESRQVNSLTYLLALFVPVSTVAAILSMGDEYLPGQTSFWIFWVASIPMVALVVLVMYSLEWIHSLIPFLISSLHRR